MRSTLGAMAQKKKGLGRPRKKPGKKFVAVSITLSPDLLRRLRKLSDAENLSLSGLIAREMSRAAGHLERRG